jgi:hypothetical protein
MALCETTAPGKTSGETRAETASPLGLHAPGVERAAAGVRP